MAPPGSGEVSRGQAQLLVHLRVHVHVRVHVRGWLPGGAAVLGVGSQMGFPWTPTLPPGLCGPGCEVTSTGPTCQDCPQA